MIRECNDRNDETQKILGLVQKVSDEWIHQERSCKEEYHRVIETLQNEIAILKARHENAEIRIQDIQQANQHLSQERDKMALEHKIERDDMKSTLSSYFTMIQEQQGKSDEKAKFYEEELRRFQDILIAKESDISGLEGVYYCRCKRRLNQSESD